MMGMAIAGVLSVLISRFGLHPPFKRLSTEREWTDVAPIDEIPEGVPVKKVVVVWQDGGWGRFISRQLVWIVKKSPQNPKDSMESPKREDNLAVYSAICPHLGCTITAVDKGFICPCHGSAWNLDGNRIGGPTPRGMDALEYRVRDGMLQVKYRFFRQGVPDKEVIS